MNEALMKKAYEDLGGVWPKGYTDLIVSTDRNPVLGGGKYGNYSLGKDVFEQSRSNPLSWKWVGTKAEFEAYGDSLKKEWMPEVGEECEYKYDFFFIDRQVGKCTPIAFHDGKVWVELSIDKTHHLIDAGKIKFCPAKSEREKLFEECVNTLKSEPQCDKVNLHHMDAIEWLIDAGFINAPSS